MFAFAFAGRLCDGGPDPSALVEWMVEGWPYRPPVACHRAASRKAAAALLVWPVRDSDNAARPLWDNAKGRLIVADIRVYNKPALDRWCADAVTDAGLLACCEPQSRTELLDRMAGDFAYVEWDDDTRTVVAVRDHFGVRPLYYCVDGPTFLAATDVTQIVLALSGRCRVDAQTVFGRLAASVAPEDGTYFEDVKRLPPAHILTGRSNKLGVRRYWSPGGGDDTSESYGERCKHVQSAFLDAVGGRLESDRPIVAHSSGGVDSTAIVMAAAHLASSRALPPLVLVAGVADGHCPADRRRISVVSEETGFETLTWNLLEAGAGLESDGAIGAPSFRWGLAGGPSFDTEVARARGAGVLLAGVLGDTLMSSFGVLRDFWGAGRLDEVLRHVAEALSLRQAVKLFLRASLGVLPPDIALGALVRLMQRGGRRPNDWMGPRLLELATRRRKSRSIERHASHLRTELWWRLSGPEVADTIDGMVLHGMREGLEVRMPFADHRLVQAVLAIPWSDRSPRGNGRRLSFDSLGAFLPATFQNRGEQESWLPVWLHHARRTFPSLATQIEERWLAEEFVRRDAAKSLLDRAVQGACRPQEEILLSQFAIFNAWLLELHRTRVCDI